MFHSIFLKHPNKYPQILISLNAVKTFNRMEWEHSVMEKFTFGFNLRSLQISPKLVFIQMTYNSDYFMFTCGTHQGCPHSPLLFILINRIAVLYSEILLTSDVIRSETLAETIYCSAMKQV